MAGWIYVFVVSSVPRHVKIGFTERDPELRAKELSGTGLPGEYSVEFSIEVDQPREVERVVHLLLQDFHHHKEWFECSVAEARLAIEKAVQRFGDESMEDQSFDGPLVPGHALRPFFRPPDPSLTMAQFVVDPDPRFLRPVYGDMTVQCKYCGHVDTIPTSHITHCKYCGKTDVRY
jgi:hypothetical protein